MPGPSSCKYINVPATFNIFRSLCLREGVEDYRLEIYNKWGELLYVSEDVMIGWDGYFKGKLCKQDVYVWRCRGTFSNGKGFELAGDVTLLHHPR